IRDLIVTGVQTCALPISSRNSLNVAIHALRRTLRTMTDVPVIVYADGTYRISRELRLWLDVDEFGRCVDSGRRLEDAGEIGQAKIGRASCRERLECLWDA